MFGNNNNFNQFSSFQQRDVIGSINSPYSPQNIVNDALKQAPFRNTIDSSSSCMKGYNPHNLLHEYHVANGGCVSDAQKSEAKVLGQIGSGILGAAEYASQNKAVTTITGTVCAAGSKHLAIKGGCVGLAYMSSEAIDSAKAFVKAQVSHNVKKFCSSKPSSNAILFCYAETVDEALDLARKDPKCSGVSEDFMRSCIEEEYANLVGQCQNDSDLCVIL